MAESVGATAFPTGRSETFYTRLRSSKARCTCPYVDEVVDNLRCELYPLSARNEESRVHAALSAMYYCVRPLLPVGIRKHLQRAHLRGWDQISFPHWPVDRSVDDLCEFLMLLTLEAQ